MKIEHSLIPGFVMEVRAQKPCEDDRAGPHPQYEVVDPEGDVDWLCARDVRVIEATPEPVVAR